MSENTSPRSRKVLRGIGKVLLFLLKAILYLMPLMIALAIAFGPLYKWDAINNWWIGIAAFIVFMMAIFAAMEEEWIGSELLVGFVLIILLTVFAGTKVFSRGAVIYHPAGQAPIVEKVGINSFYPWWRMDDRTVLRNARGTLSESGRYVTADDRMIEFSVSVEYRVPSRVLLQHYQQGHYVDYPQRVQRGFERAVAIIVQRTAPETPQALFNNLAAEINNQLEALGGPVHHMRVTFEHEGSRVVIEAAP